MTQQVMIPFNNVERVQPACVVNSERDPNAPLGQPSASLIFKPYGMLIGYSAMLTSQTPLTPRWKR